MPQASTLIRTWLGPTSGTSRSTTSNGPPAFDTCTALIFATVASSRMDAGADARAAAMIHGPGMASQLPGRREGGDNLPMNRSRLAGLLAFCAVVLPHAARADEFQLVEATIADVQREMRSGRLTPEALTRMYLQRIAAYDRRLNAFAHLNEHALEAARAPGAGPLFGVPSSSRTTSTPETCPPRPAPWRWQDRCRYRTLSSRRSCARRARSSWERAR